MRKYGNQTQTIQEDQSVEYLWQVSKSCMYCRWNLRKFIYVCSSIVVKNLLMYLSTEKFIISTTFNFMKWACRNTSSATFCMFSFFTGFYATLTFISFNMTMQVKTWKKSHIFFLIIKISFIKIILFSSFTLCLWFYQIVFFSTKQKNSINHNYRYVAWKSFYEIYGSGDMYQGLNDNS